MNKNMKQKILYLLPKLGIGGLEHEVVDLANNITNTDKYKVFIIAEEGPLGKKLHPNIQYYKLNIGSKNIFKIIFNFRLVKKIVLTHDIKIIHAHSRIPGLIAYFLKKRMKIKTIYTEHGVHSYNNKWKQWYNTIPLHNDQIISVSHYVTSILIEEYRITSEKIATIPLGINTKIFTTRYLNTNKMEALAQQLSIYDLGAKVLFMPARITPIKNQLNILMGIKNIAQHHNIILVIAGKIDHQSYYKTLAKYIQNNNLSQYVRIISNISDMPAMYSFAYATIAMSLKPEAFGKTVIESYAMSRPVIGTTKRSIADNVIDGETGLLCNPNNVQDIQDTLDKFLNLDEYVYNKMCEKAFELSKKFSYIKNLEDTMSIYDSI